MTMSNMPIEYQTGLHATTSYAMLFSTMPLVEVPVAFIPSPFMRVQSLPLVASTVSVLATVTVSRSPFLASIPPSLYTFPIPLTSHHN